MLYSRTQRIELKAKRTFAFKNYRATVRHLEELLRHVGENPQTLYMLAMCHDRLGQQEHALEHARRALKSDPLHFSTLQLLASLHVRAGTREEAKRYAHRALEQLASRPLAAPHPGGWLSRLLAWIGASPSESSESDLTPADQDWAIWARALLEEDDDAAPAYRRRESAS